MQHLDANTVQEMMGGTLAGPAQDEALGHLDRCADCRELLVVLSRLAVGTSVRSASALVDPVAATGSAGGAAGGGEVAGFADTMLGPDAREPTIVVEDATLAAGTVIGRYVVTDVIGAGGMGMVYAADDPELGRRVALKLLRPDLRGGSARTRLVREAQAMARVSHPNVIAVHDVGTWEGQVFVAMELVARGHLRRWVKEKPRSPAEIVDAFAAAGRGLAAAHAAGLVHRDFKPDNVLVGDDGRVRVTDFGLARAEGAADETDVAAPSASALDVALTRTGAVMGTPAYMAPEQFEGGNVDARSDQFSFCVALYEALYDERPFQGRSVADLSAAVRAGEIRPPRAGSQVPPSLRAIVLRGLQRRPGDRFPTMEALLAALGRDRGRVPRFIALIAAALALAVGVGLFADWIVRDRVLATARASFRAASGQLERSLALRYEAFVLLSDLSYMVPVMREVTGNLDQADFGLGSAADDAAALANLHDTLRSDDWIDWAEQTGRGVIAVADYKGRLIYTTADPRRWGDDLRRLPAAARAFDPAHHGESAAVVRGDDPVLLASGVTGGAVRPGLVVVFARAVLIGGAPRALFVQLVDGARLLDDVALGEGTRLALASPDGAFEGDAPPAVVAAGLEMRTGDHEVELGDSDWLVQSLPLAGLSGDDEIARLVLARPVDVGLAGLFAGARTVLGVLVVLLIATCAVATVLARRGLRPRSTQA